VVISLKRLFLLFFLVLFITGCGASTPVATPLAIRIIYTAATQPWLADLERCAGRNVVDARLAATDGMDIQSSDLAMRIGTPDASTFPTYQIGTEAIQVIANPNNPVKKLDLAQVRSIFTGRIQNWQELGGPDSKIEVWVFAAGEDVEQLFEQAALNGSPVTSQARLAVSPAEMAAAVANDANAVGVLTKSWKADGVTNLLTVVEEPVLVLTPAEPQGAVLTLINCLQK
jgi:hypothetical protein